MPKLERRIEESVKARWPSWIRARFEDWQALPAPRGTRTALVEEVRSTGLVGAFPTSRIREWVDGERAPGAETAFAVGEALRALPVGLGSRLSEWVSGPVALHAAGYVADCIGLFAHMIRHDGAPLVMGFIPALPILTIVPSLTDDQRAKAKTLGEHELDTWVRVARDEAALCSMRQGPFVRFAWRSWTEKRALYGAPPAFQAAYELASSDRLPLECVTRWSWELLHRWAESATQELRDCWDYERLGGQYYSIWRLLEFIGAAAPAIDSPYHET